MSGPFLAQQLRTDGQGTGENVESLFFARNPTTGTGIASLDAATSYSATVALMTVFNNTSLTGSNPNVWVHPLKLRLWATAVNTSGTDARIVVALDNINRYSSGGSAITPVSRSHDTRSGYTQRTPASVIHFGAITAASASSANVLLNHPFVKTAIFAASEGVELVFGDVSAGGIDTADQNITRLGVGPVFIGRGCTMVIHYFCASQAADPAFEFEFEFAERGHTTFGQ